jgi:RNase adapter protein RapZ
MRIIVVTGISGSGKSVALKVLEDAGYFCIDNLPCELLMAAAQHAHSHGVEHFAVAIDVRSIASQPLQLNQAFHSAIEALRRWQLDVRLLFLSANNATLIARYSETRRSHPLSRLKFTLNEATSTDSQTQNHYSLEECIDLERQYLLGVYESSHVIDTSGLVTAALRHSVRQFAQATGVGITLTFESFGFKYALPQDADLVFDARCLPNPHYEPLLKPLTGLDTPVIQYLEQLSVVNEFVNDLIRFIQTWLPRYQQDGRHYLTVAIGCTGGQHRSVYVAERLAAHFSNTTRVITRHRQQAAKL